MKTIPWFLCSGIVNNFQCGGCIATYHGKTERHFNVRMSEHLVILAFIGKWVKGDVDSGIKEHLLFLSYAPDFEDFSIPTTNNNDFKITLIENVLINRDHLRLNKNKQSLLLELLGN